MKLINPTANAIEIQIEGVRYAVEAEDCVRNVPEAHARIWKDTHEFLHLDEDDAVEAPKAEAKDETKDEAPKEEAPKEAPEEEEKPKDKAKKTK